MDLGVEAPGPQGATRAHTRRYVAEEQRSGTGCIGVQNMKVISARALTCGELKEVTLQPKLPKHLPSPFREAVREVLENWQRSEGTRRLWCKDGSLWTGRDEGRWLDWLDVVEAPWEGPQRAAGFSHVVLLGMGGSSLCAEVLARTFGRADGFPELLVLDSIDPAQVLSVERRIDMSRTLFIVASKSGSTLEPELLREHFFARTGGAGQQFIAITDPGSKLAQVAGRDGFRQVFCGIPNIGGRYSALSNFGMIPAALAGYDVPRLLEGARRMAAACRAEEENPGVQLGASLAVAAQLGRDKITLAASPGLRSLGTWLEQLLAESTGKQGRGLIPIDAEPLGPPQVYGEDRMFVYMRMGSAPDAAQDAAIAALEKSGHPVLRLGIAGPYALGEEFFRWEVATAVAGSILGIHPFDQPDVEAAKVATRKLTTAYEQQGSLPEEPSEPRPTDALRAHFASVGPGDYFGLLAFVEMNESTERSLQAWRVAVRDKKRVATSLGFGPRYLHSTGQLHKGGPKSGVFVMITCDDAQDVKLAGRSASLGIVRLSQALGDFQVLRERGQRVIRLHLEGDREAARRQFSRSWLEALA